MARSRTVHLSGMRKHTPEPVPVTIPTVVLQVRDDGTVDATLDGHPLPPPDQAGRWRRTSLPQIIDHASNDRTIPVRIEVHETDGSTFTDLVTARPKHATNDTQTARQTALSPRRVAPPAFHSIEATGFVPGEDVAVAIILSHTDATGTGHARTLIDLDTLPDSHTHEVILFGRISGTLAVRRLP